MRNRLQNIGAFACAALLSLSIVGCGQQASSSATSENSNTTREEVEKSVHDDTDPTANGRIDVTTKGSQVARYHGSKYIVSDATADQTTDDMGLQEICVVRQPESWQQIKSIGWDRNSISYAGVSMPWGEISYRYEYVNEAGAAPEMAEYSRTKEENVLSGLQNVEHTELDGHQIAYAYDEQDEDYVSMGIVDLEAQAQGEQEGTTGHTVSLYSYEQRGDKCSFLVTATCLVTDDSAYSLSREDLLKEAYAPLEFASKDAEVDAASFLADVAISNASGDKSAVIKRDGKHLISYTEHSATLFDGEDNELLMLTTTYDYAPEEAAPEDAEEYEIDGRYVRALERSTSSEGFEEDIIESAIEAWVDVDGDTMHIRADIKDGESIEETLQRVIAGRINPS